MDKVGVSINLDTKKSGLMNTACMYQRHMEVCHCGASMGSGRSSGPVQNEGARQSHY